MGTDGLQVACLSNPHPFLRRPGCQRGERGEQLGLAAVDAQKVPGAQDVAPFAVLGEVEASFLPASLVTRKPRGAVDNLEDRERDDEAITRGSGQE